MKDSELASPQHSALRKWLLSGGVIVASIGYALWQNLAGTAPTQLTNVPSAEATSTQSANASTTSYVDGTYTGDAVNAYYGIVQVRAVVEAGKLSSVQLLQQPNDRPETIAVSNRSFPLLIQEALQIQSARVHTVSGATQTSEGFQASLASALTEAHA